MMKDKSTKRAKRMAAIVKQLKSLIVPIILCIIILIGVYVVINYQGTEEEQEAIQVHAYDGSETPLILENDMLVFTMDPATTQFEVKVKDSEKIWYSNPQGAEQDTIALTSEKGKLRSTIAMTYSTTTGLETLYNNYDYSIAKGIYEIEEGDDYIKVCYSLGDLEKEFVIPPVATAEEFEALLANMKKDYAVMIQQYYKKYDISNLGKRDDKEQLLADYPILSDEVIYVLRDNTKDGLKIKFQQYFEEAGYTYEAYLADKELNQAAKSSDKPVFNVNIIYRLEEDELVVELPLEELEYREEYPIYTITPLPFFGAGSTQEEGFILVPEGGGALINFNNGKNAQNSYYANVYGWDMALVRDAVVHNTRTCFNAYGISDNENSFLCTLEEGAAYASVQADISGRYNSYNFVNTSYSIKLREKYDVGDIANSSVYVYIPELPKEKLVQRYSFINSGSYVDMAKEYQKDLEKKYEGYLTKKEDTQAPAVLEIIGAVDKIKQVMGIPVSQPLKLTSYQEADQMVQQLYEGGLKNLSVKMTGWCNGGVKQHILKSVKTISELGSKKELQNMIDNVRKLGVDVYLDGVTQYAYDSNLLDGFFSFRDAARFISKERAELYDYSAITYAALNEGQDSYYLLHNDLTLVLAQNLQKSAAQYGAGVSFRENGMELSADYYKKNMVSRQEAMNRQINQFQEMADEDRKVMINMGNDYAAVYSDVITNMDLHGTEYTILDTYVPFYQMALHGYVNYTCTPLNLSGDTQEVLLQSAEYGAGLYFSMMKETAFALQKTLYTEYYGSDYTVWHDRMLEIYNRYNAELGTTFNQKMTNHEQIMPKLSCTTYQDGTRVYVNYSYADVTTSEGVMIPARDYKVVQ